MILIEDYVFSEKEDDADADLTTEDNALKVYGKKKT